MSDLQPLRHIQSTIRVASSKAPTRPQDPDRGDFIQPQKAIGSLWTEIEEEAEGFIAGVIDWTRHLAAFSRARSSAHLMLFSPQGELP